LASGDGQARSALCEPARGKRKGITNIHRFDWGLMHFVFFSMKRSITEILTPWWRLFTWVCLLLAILFLGIHSAKAADHSLSRSSYRMGMSWRAVSAKKSYSEHGAWHTIYEVTFLLRNGLICPDRERIFCRKSTPGLEGLALPDLQTLPPFDFRLHEYRVSGRREIRFANSVWNSGEAVLELHGEYDPGKNTVVFNQHLFGEGQREITHRVGEFSFHKEHNHWHWEDFSIYEIWSLAPDGSLDEIVATSGKVGYCMLDIRRVTEEEIATVPIDETQVPDTRQFRGCGWRTQGISIGWVDTYFAYTPGQVMDITELRDGFYAFRSTVDPGGNLHEADEGNNSATIYFSLFGSEFRLIGGAFSASCLVDEIGRPAPGFQIEICK
jgi:hypothetical protein